MLDDDDDDDDDYDDDETSTHALIDWLIDLLDRVLAIFSHVTHWNYRQMTSCRNNNQCCFYATIP